MVVVESRELAATAQLTRLVNIGRDPSQSRLAPVSVTHRGYCNSVCAYSRLRTIRERLSNLSEGGL